jgi:hypothetical protein
LKAQSCVDIKASTLFTAVAIQTDFGPTLGSGLILEASDSPNGAYMARMTTLVLAAALSAHWGGVAWAESASSKTSSSNNSKTNTTSTNTSAPGAKDQQHREL